MDGKKKSSSVRKNGREMPKPNTNRPDARELAAKDSRFASVFSNPIYRPVPKQEKKVDIDKRFQSMFHDEKFKLKYKVDKRGRPVSTTTDENLMKYYNLVDDEDESKDSDEEEEKPEIKDEIKSDDDSSDDDDEEEEEEDEDEEIEGEVDEKEIQERPKKGGLSQKIKEKLHDMDIDYARGEGLIVSDGSSSDDDSSSSDLEDDTEDLMHEWGELDKDAPRTEESTRRLALCNMDWDRLKANDLMVLFSSFLPPGGLLKNVSIYPSEFGKSRMAEEDLKGPLELIQFKEEPSSDFEGEDDEELEQRESQRNRPFEDEGEDEGSSYHREKLRQYQLNRLKYFYAVLEFDSVETAEKVYTECDGREYESSAAKIDLRFIPDDMVFDETPSDACDRNPDGAKYRPKFFTTTALQQIKVDCTWDETDPSRKDIIQKTFDPKEKIDDEDIRAYLASSSEEEELSDDESSKNESNENKAAASDPISKYRALLESIEESEKKKKDKDVELEITWGVGLKKKTEELVKKKLEKEEEATRTPWEEILAKRKEKKKEKNVAKRAMQKKSNDGSSDDESDEDDDSQPFSDDEVDVDMNDPFFREEMRNNDVFKQNKSKPSGKSKSKKDQSDKEENSKSNAELELLLMDEDEGKNHFSFKKILADDNESKSKKKRKLKKKKDALKPTEKKDDFDVDVGDSRFSALFTSHHYNIDPSDPNFKRSKGMEVIIGEKQKRRVTTKNDDATDELPARKVAKSTPQGSSDDSSLSSRNKKAELSYLVKSIKRNTLNISEKDKRKLKPRS